MPTPSGTTFPSSLLFPGEDSPSSEMAIDWSAPGNLDPGLDRGVLYLPSMGVAWSGLVSIEEKPEGGETSSYHFDGVKIIDIVSGETYSFTLQAFTYPEEFEGYDGLDWIYDKQIRSSFGFSYRAGTKLHLVYNVTASPSAKTFQTIAEDVDVTDFSWEMFTTPESVPGLKPSSHLIVDTQLAHPSALAELETLLYGIEGSVDPRLPLPTEIVDIFNNYAVLVVVDHGDGTWTATGPDEAIQMLDADSFEINWPSANYISANIYTISTM